MHIRCLPDIIVQQIAAGEVVERPVSVVKELIENAIDAGATKISVVLRDVGKKLILVSDNGCGMSKEDLELSAKFHTTSKFTDLHDIGYLGFRGEALAAIASVSRLSISSKDSNEDLAWKISLDAGVVKSFVPISWDCGTCVEVNDLFFNTPARAKFLKNDVTESNKVRHLVKMFALIYPEIDLSLIEDEKRVLHFFSCSVDNTKNRVSAVLSKEFVDNSIYFEDAFHDMHLSCYLGLPTYVQNTASQQFYFVNGRYIRDKLLFCAVKNAYSDVIKSGSYPVLIMHLCVPNNCIDVNVHPAKMEVRFRHENRVRDFLIRSLKRQLMLVPVTSTHKLQLVSKVADENVPVGPIVTRTTWVQDDIISSRKLGDKDNKQFSSVIKDCDDISAINAENNKLPNIQDVTHVDTNKGKQVNSNDGLFDKYGNFGVAKCQIHDSYILAETKDGLLIVDQHAAAERILYEELKAQHAKKLLSQELLVVKELSFDDEQIRVLRICAEKLQMFGWGIVVDSASTVTVSSMPSLLIDNCDIKSFLLDVIECFYESDTLSDLSRNTDSLLASMACYGSIRFGQKLSMILMQNLLDKMSQTPNISQCNHGRPTYCKFTLTDLDNLMCRG